MKENYLVKVNTKAHDSSEEYVRRSFLLCMCLLYTPAGRAWAACLSKPCAEKSADSGGTKRYAPGH